MITKQKRDLGQKHLAFWDAQLNRNGVNGLFRGAAIEELSTLSGEMIDTKIDWYQFDK